jgi:hypothetical protein
MNGLYGLLTHIKIGKIIVSLREKINTILNYEYRPSAASDVAYVTNDVKLEAIMAAIQEHLGRRDIEEQGFGPAWQAYQRELGRPPESPDAMILALRAAIPAMLKDTP